MNFFEQEPELEIKNIIIKVEKLEDKMQGVKAESAQNSDKKNEAEKIVSNQISDVPSATVEANGIDNEDSINLTIGEDEENLLAEEVWLKKGIFFLFEKLRGFCWLVKVISISKIFFTRMKKFV